MTHFFRNTVLRAKVDTVLRPDRGIARLLRVGAPVKYVDERPRVRADASGELFVQWGRTLGWVSVRALEVDPEDPNYTTGSAGPPELSGGDCTGPR